MQQKEYGIFSLPVIVGALGFFVDIYDLLLFNIVRKSSFRDLGVAESAMSRQIFTKKICCQWDAAADKLVYLIFLYLSH